MTFGLGEPQQPEWPLNRDYLADFFDEQARETDREDLAGLAVRVRELPEHVVLNPMLEMLRKHGTSVRSSSDGLRLPDTVAAARAYAERARDDVRWLERFVLRAAQVANRDVKTTTARMLADAKARRREALGGNR